MEKPGVGVLPSPGSIGPFLSAWASRMADVPSPGRAGRERPAREAGVAGGRRSRQPGRVVQVGSVAASAICFFATR